MDEEIDGLMIGVRADTGSFARDVAQMKDSLTQGLGGGAATAATSITAALAKATGSGKSGFDDLKSVALKALDEIAASALKSGVSAIGGGGLGSLASGLLAGLLGLPGRATGGPVAPGSAYLVGERGPELFVPTSSGSVVANGAGGSREVKVSIAVNAPSGSAPQALGKSGRQVARAVTQALRQAEG